MKALFAILCFIPVGSQAQDKLNYDDHILPIFEKSCTNCHNPDKKKGDLDLSTYGGFLTGSSGGKIASAGDGSGSKIFATASHSEEPFMPPKGKGEKLDKKDIMQIRQWIDGGLLETKDSKAKVDNTPKIDFSKINANTPDGPAPMPENLSIEPVTTPKIAGVISDIECSPTAPVLAITGQQQVLLYHTETLELIGVIPFTSDKAKSKKGVMNPESLSFHPAGKFLLVGGGIAGKSGLTICWDVTNGKSLMMVAKEYDTVIATSLRKDLQGVATGGPSKRVKLWDASTNTIEFNHKKHTDWVTALSYSHDGVLLASGGRAGGVWIWEAQSGNEFHKLDGHKARIVAIKWSPDSNYLATASEDGSLRIWNMRDGKEVKKIEAHKAGILDMDWSSKGEFVTVGRDGFIKIWKSDYSLKKQFQLKPEIPLRAEWNHDSKRVFVADYKGEVSVWDADLKPIGKIDSNPKPVAHRISENVVQTGKLQLLLAAINDKIENAEKQVQTIQDSIRNTEQQLVDNRKAYQLAQQNERKSDALKRKQQQEVSKIQAQIKKVVAEIKQLEKPVEVEQARQTELVKAAKTKIQQLGDQLQKTQAQLKSSDANIKKFKAEFNKRSDLEKPLTEKITVLKKELPKAKQQIDKLKEPRETVENKIKVLQEKISRLRDYLSQNPKPKINPELKTK